MGGRRAALSTGCHWPALFRRQQTAPTRLIRLRVAPHPTWPPAVQGELAEAQAENELLAAQVVGLQEQLAAAHARQEEQEEQQRAAPAGAAAKAEKAGEEQDEGEAVYTLGGAGSGGDGGGWEGDDLLGLGLGLDLLGAPASANGRSPALPATPTAAISNPAFSPEKEGGDLHQQVGQGAGKEQGEAGPGRLAGRQPAGPAVHARSQAAVFGVHWCGAAPVVCPPPHFTLLHAHPVGLAGQPRCNLPDSCLLASLPCIACCASAARVVLQVEALQAQLAVAEAEKRALREEVEQLRALGVQQVRPSLSSAWLPPAGGWVAGWVAAAVLASIPA